MPISQPTSRSPVHSLEEHHRVQRPQSRKRNALLRAGCFPESPSQRSVNQQRVSRRARSQSSPVAHGRHRRDHGSNFISTPSSRRPQVPAWLTDLINGDHAAGGSSNAAAVAGYPDITVPAGFIDWPARRHVVLRSSLERTDIVATGVLVSSKPPRSANRHGS